MLLCAEHLGFVWGIASHTDRPSRQMCAPSDYCILTYKRRDVSLLSAKAAIDELPSRTLHMYAARAAVLSHCGFFAILKSSCELHALLTGNGRFLPGIGIPPWGYPAP